MWLFRGSTVHDALKRLLRDPVSRVEKIPAPFRNSIMTSVPMPAREPVKTSNPFGALGARQPSSIDAATPTSSTDGKKKRKKKKKKAPSGASSNGGVDEPDSDGDSQLGSEGGGRSEAMELPLPRRLEIAASHVDIQVALVGLVGWSRMYVNTETIMEIFQCDALQLLFTNILRAHPKAESIYDNLSSLLANCLYIERDDKGSSANKQIAGAVVETLRTMMKIVDQDGAKVSDNAVTADKLAAYLSRIVRKYRLSLSGMKPESVLSHEVISIEARLAAAAIKDSEVKGQGIRDSFRRRDIRSDALDLYASRLYKLVQLRHDSVSIDKLAADAQAGFLSFALKDVEDDLRVDETIVQEAQARARKLEEEKLERMAPINEKLRQQNERLQQLQEERAKLEERLRAVNSEIDQAQQVKVELSSEITAINDEFAEATLRCAEQDEHIMGLYRQIQRRDQIHQAFTRLEESISAISLTNDDAVSYRDKHATSLRQHIEGALRYFGSELPCIKFMINRVEETEEKLNELLGEASGYESLGVESVAKELKEKAEVIRSHLNEDIECVAALKKRDLEVINMLERVFQDSVHEEALAFIDDNLKREAMRHIEYVKMVHSGIKPDSNRSS